VSVEVYRCHVMIIERFVGTTVDPSQYTYLIITENSQQQLCNVDMRIYFAICASDLKGLDLCVRRLVFQLGSRRQTLPPTGALLILSKEHKRQLWQSEHS
jgi:hypothetical protein